MAEKHHQHGKSVKKPLGTFDKRKQGRGVKIDQENMSTGTAEPLSMFNDRRKSKTEGKRLY